MKNPLSSRLAMLAVSAAVIAFVAMLARPLPSAALPDYAAKTGQACATCHINPAGGGARTPLGLRFEAIANHATDPAGAFTQAQAAAQPTATAAPKPVATATAAPKPVATPTVAAAPAATPTAAAKPAASPTASPAATATPGALPRTGDFPLAPLALGGGALLAALGWSFRRVLNR